MTYVFVSVLILIVCILLALIVLVQNSKGGGLAANFQASNQYIGVRQTADFLEKATWTFAIILLVLSLMSVFIIPRQKDDAITSEVASYIEEKGASTYIPPPPEQ